MTKWHLILLCLVWTFQGMAADYTLRWGINVEPIVYFKKASATFKKNIETRSKGRIKVELFENVVPQEGHDHLGDVMNGKYHMAQETVFALQRRIPEFEIWNLPFLFIDDKHVIRYTKSKLALSHMEKLKSFGVVGLGYTYSGGFLEIFGDKIDSFTDLKGSLFALEESGLSYQKMLTDFFDVKLTDFNPTNSSIKASEIIASTGREIYPLAKDKTIYWNITDHRVISRILFISTEFINSLPDDLQKIVLEEGKKVAALERSYSIEDKYVVQNELAKKNIKINRWSNARKLSEKKRFLNLYQSYEQRRGASSLLFLESLR